jgi:hypothetical protein
MRTSADCARPPSSKRGYGKGWKAIRERTLIEWHIPRALWPDFVIDHFPRYGLFGPNHDAYKLLPVYHPRHSSMTLKQTHKGISATWRIERQEQAELFNIDTYVNQPSKLDLNEW